jgi:hypothetical protein
VHCRRIVRPWRNRTRHCTVRNKVAIVRRPVGVRRCERCRAPCNVRRLPLIVRRSLVLPTRSTPAPAPIPLAQRASLLAAEPAVTTRRSPAPTWRCVPLAQVTSPSDGLPDPSASLLGRAMRLVVCPRLAGVKKRRHGVPMNSGSRVRIDAATPRRERHRRQAPRAAVARSNETAQPGVVSRRPLQISPRPGAVRRTETLT